MCFVAAVAGSPRLPRCQSRPRGSGQQRCRLPSIDRDFPHKSVSPEALTGRLTTPRTLSNVKGKRTSIPRANRGAFIRQRLAPLGTNQQFVF
ncbi:hypothetical protein TGRH88_057820 [Toxoplasma gondii]|uniref:Uncharacterized protein n=2 Tax=Toxoplasma gondii TaxID=5811 RepID=A0A0F7VDP8_TOXGV|nr:hypothetical protein TGRH88_057820 [Toxoplasma gondii]CEL78065.1 TPA: hypothetical protein BN1205_070045 [Toxoplasma gondii VEG]